MILLADLGSHIALYLWAFSFKPRDLWDKEVTNFTYKFSLADVFFIMLIRVWISGISLNYRWSFLGVALGVVSTGALVVKAAEFSLWIYPENAQKDLMLVLSIFFSIVGPPVAVPFAVVSLQKHWLALEEEYADPNAEPVKRQLTMKELYLVLRSYFWPRGIVNRVRATSTWFILAVSKISNILAPLYLAKATNHLQQGNLQGATLNVGVYCALRFTSTTFKEFQNMAYLSVKQAAYIEIAHYTFVHLHNLSLDWHLRKKMGNVLRAMDRGVESANSVVNYLFLYLLPTMAECLTVCFIFLLHYGNGGLAIVVFFSLVLYAHVTIKLTLWRKKFREATNKHDNEFHERATDSLINYETVKYFNNEAHEVEQYCQAVTQYQKYSTGTQYSLSLLNISQQALQIGCMCLAMIIMIYSKSDVGAFVAVQAYLIQLFQPLNFLGSIYGAIVNGLVDVRNLSELLAESPDLTDKPDAPELECSLANPPACEYRNVCFHYPTQVETQGLHNVSFVAEGGKVTATVGATGSGKTTLGRLLFRFYDPRNGTVLINGLDVASVTQKSVRRAIGVVPQDTVMFNDTVLHNVSYGRIGAPFEEVERCCEKAQILDFIRSLPEGWQTRVGERGLKLSGGEKQRVAIARCLLKNPPIVLLDEATSALDSRTEREVQSALSDLGQNRTTLVIAHRLSTIRTADLIVVMGGGRVLEKGTHAELLGNVGGSYSLLWNAQIHEHVDSSSQLSTLSSEADLCPNSNPLFASQ